ncbi:unnamed protein product [Peronospora belbahrii]|uniref:Anaphase-promoting complex subunit 4 WD40 domain-containing protein n=1 Tax=Peronospora belbahrii TaxID=622444 RepID=A0ABN8CND7_9STRA|nr:unnamed protein product [Peronospora belbahrii]
MSLRLQVKLMELLRYGIWRSIQKIQQFRVDADVMDMEASRNGTILTIAAGKQVYFYDAKVTSLLFSIHFQCQFLLQRKEGHHCIRLKNKFVAGGSDTWVRVFEDSESGELLETH